MSTYSLKKLIFHVLSFMIMSASYPLSRLHRDDSSRAFTLVELIIVIVILALLGTI